MSRTLDPVSPAPLALASAFPAASEADWMALVDGVLKGAPFEKKLVNRSAEGVRTRALAPRRADASVIAPARGSAPWVTFARVDDPNLTRANATLLAELEGGADGIALTFAGGVAARGFGLPSPTVEVLDAALAGVHCDLVAIRMETSPFHGRAAALAFADLMRARRMPGATLSVDFGFAPLVYLALTGGEGQSFAAIMRGAQESVKRLRDEGFSGPFYRADGRMFHDAGAGEAEELASIIAQAVSLIRALDAEGVPVAEAAAMIGFTLAVDQEQFAGIAKIRALRLLWARIAMALDLPPRAIAIHAETSFRMMTRRDPQVNILRATIAAFSAATGGADTLAILPFTLANGLPDANQRRLARNTSLILAAESNLNRVIDPASGAGGIEAMTDALAEAAWSLFQEIERQQVGEERGLPAALANGTLAARIAATRKARLADIATRRWPITGTSEFPNIAETAPEVLAPAPAMPLHASFPALRLGAPYEALRDQADSLAGKGNPPRVFLACLGTIAEFTPRAGFAKNAYEAGGIAAITNDGFAETGGTDLVAMTDAFKASGATVACLCGTDQAYALEATDAAMALAASGARVIHLAGKPGDLESGLRAAGVSGFLAMGMDLPAFLGETLAALAGEAA